MSAKEVSTVELRQEKTWVACVGDFAILKKFFAQKEAPIWYMVQLFDALLRGFGHTVFANNPLSGLLIIVTLAAVAPGTLALSAATGVLGLLVSVVIQEPEDIVENGLSVYNPVLVGAISYVLIPRIYGAFDAFSFLLVFLATILRYLELEARYSRNRKFAMVDYTAELAAIHSRHSMWLDGNVSKFQQIWLIFSSVYLARSLRSDKFACTAWPFNLVEFALIFALSTQNGAEVLTKSMEPMYERHNATSETTMTTTSATTTMNDAGFYPETATNVYIDWGMILRGSVVSASQLFGIDNVIVGAVMYLAMLIYSPASTAFSFFGALCGTFAGLELGADYHKVYSGFWGYNSLLTGAALGGNLLVLNGQTAAATVMAIIFTSLLQYSIESIFIKARLPILALPFVIATSLFLKLSNGKGDLTFPWPVSPISFPEKQRHDYLVRRAALKEEDTLCVEELELVIQNEKGPTQPDN